MPEPRQRRPRPRVALCAVITFDGKLDTSGPPPTALLDFLARETPPAIQRQSCLGPPELFRALLDAGRVDDLFLVVRPRVDGHLAAPTLSGPPTPEFFPRSLSCRLRRMEVHGGECLLHYTVTRPRPR